MFVVHHSFYFGNLDLISPQTQDTYTQALSLSRCPIALAEWDEEKHLGLLISLYRGCVVCVMTMITSGRPNPSSLFAQPPCVVDTAPPAPGIYYCAKTGKTTKKEIKRKKEPTPFAQRPPTRPPVPVS